MSTPKGFNKLWKNVTWASAEEKLAFFNKYFLKDKIAADYVTEKLKSFKQSLIEFIQEGKIKEGNKERNITIRDIINEIKK